MENIELGLLLMVVGMVTVFVILLIVIWLSQLRSTQKEGGCYRCIYRCWCNGCH